MRRSNPESAQARKPQESAGRFPSHRPALTTGQAYSPGPLPRKGIMYENAAGREGVAASLLLALGCPAAANDGLTGDQDLSRRCYGKPLCEGIAGDANDCKETENEVMVRFTDNLTAMPARTYTIDMDFLSAITRRDEVPLLGDLG